MFGKLFESKDQRKHRKTRRTYEDLMRRYTQIKRSFRVNAATNFSVSNPDCSFLMSDDSDNFLVYDAVKCQMIEGRFIDDYVVRPEFVPDDAPAESWTIALENYRKATEVFGVELQTVTPFHRTPRSGQKWLGNVSQGEIYGIKSAGYRATITNCELILYVAVKRNGEVIASVNFMDIKQPLHFFSYLPTVLAQFATSAIARLSRITVEVLT